MEAQHRPKNPRTQSKLSQEALNELEELAALARKDPAILEAIRQRQRDEAHVKIFMLSPDELEAIDPLLDPEHDQ